MAHRLDDFDDYEMLSVAEVATCLRIGEDLIYELIHENRLPAIRLGRKIRIPAFGLRQWMRRQAGVPDLPAERVSSGPHQQRH